MCYIYVCYYNKIFVFEVQIWRIFRFVFTYIFSVSPSLFTVSYKYNITAAGGDATGIYIRKANLYSPHILYLT